MEKESSSFDIMPYFAEGIGTFALIFFGAGCAALQTPGNSNQMLTVGFVFALILFAIIAIWGDMSGANVNPVVSFVLALDQRISPATCGGYVLAQFIGCVFAGALLLYIFGSGSSLGYTSGSLTVKNPTKAVVVELILTFIFVLVILVVTAPTEENCNNDTTNASAAIAFTLGLGVILGYTLTGGSLNPFRSLGPALFSGNLATIWIYFLGPIVGGLLAFITYSIMFNKEISNCYNYLHYLL